MIYERIRIWYTLIYSIDIYYILYIHLYIVQTVHGSTNMWQHPTGWPGPSRCSCHAMQLGCSHHTLVLLHHGPLKHPQTPKHMGLPEKAPPQKKTAESQQSSPNVFFVSEVKIKILKFTWQLKLITIDCKSCRFETTWLTALIISLRSGVTMWYAYFWPPKHQARKHKQCLSVFVGFSLKNSTNKQSVRKMW